MCSGFKKSQGNLRLGWFYLWSSKHQKWHLKSSTAILHWRNKVLCLDNLQILLWTVFIGNSFLKKKLWNCLEHWFWKDTLLMTFFFLNIIFSAFSSTNKIPFTFIVLGWQAGILGKDTSNLGTYNHWRQMRKYLFVISLKWPFHFFLVSVPQ